MVGPSISEEERQVFLRRLRIAFALLVGGSMALVTLHAGAGTVAIATALVAGTAVGGALALYVIPDGAGRGYRNR